MSILVIAVDYIFIFFILKRKKTNIQSGVQVVGYWGHDVPKAEKKKKEEGAGGEGKKSGGKGKRSVDETKAKESKKAKRQKGKKAQKEVGTGAKVSGGLKNSCVGDKTKKPRTVTKAKPDCEHLNRFVKMPFAVNGAEERNWLGQVCAKDRHSKMSNTRFN